MYTFFPVRKKIELRVPIDILYPFPISKLILIHMQILSYYEHFLIRNVKLNDTQFVLISSPFSMRKMNVRLLKEFNSPCPTLLF